MALSPGLKVAGSAMTSVAEGLQAIPELLDKDEELQLRRAERPLTLEEARLRIQKTREDLNKPHFTTHGMYERDPVTGKYTYTQTEDQKRYSAKEAEMGALATWGDYPEGTPQRRYFEAVLSKLTGTREAKTPYTAQLWQKYYRGETTEAEEMILKQELAKSVKPVPESGRLGSTLPYVELPPRPGGGAPAPTPEVSPGSAGPQGMSAPSTTPAQPLEASYAAWFRQAGREWAEHVIEGMAAENHPNAEIAMKGFWRAYPSQAEAAPQPSAARATRAPVPATAPTASTPNEQALTQSYAAWFRGAGEPYARQVLAGMVKGQHANAPLAMEGFTLAYPTSGLRIPSRETAPAPGTPAASQPAVPTPTPLPPGTLPAPQPATPAPLGPGPSPAYQARQEQARLRSEQAQLKVASDPRNVQARALFAQGQVPSATYLTNPPEAQARIDQAVLEAKTEEAARKPLRSAERTSFVNPETLTTPAVQTWAEARQKGLVLLAKEDAAAVRLGNVLYSKLNRAQETLERLVETDPAWQALKSVTGFDERTREATLLGAQNSMQTNPLVRQLQSDLSEMGISYGMFVSGLKGRPAERILERTTAGLPGLDTRLFHAGGSNWLQTALNLVSTGRLPDLPRTITAQLEMMKDVTRTVQESFLESAGAMTADVAAERRLTRMQRILELTRPEPPAPAPTPAPGRRTTGPEVLPEALRQTLPALWKALTP
jgi:hypothetical protein